MKDFEMLNNFVNLNRSFALIPKVNTFDEDEYDLPINLRYLETKKWADLLKIQRVIILAEAGAGKTEEIRATAQTLRNDDKKAFFFRLEHLCSDFRESFDIGNYTEFTEWLSSDHPGWFFLDSVDEARLTGPKQFEAAIRKFGSELGESKHRAHIFITSRHSEWRPQSDLSLVKEKLPCYEYVSTAELKIENTLDILDETFANIAFTSSNGNEGERKYIEPVVFALRPLDQDQIRTFSKTFGIQELEAFLEAIQKAEADIFSTRPRDLVELISYWNDHKKIDNREKLIEASISSKLKEVDPDRLAAMPLTFEDARYGAEMLAAAVTFLRKSRILIPDQNTNLSVEVEAIDTQNILTDWDFIKIKALLQRPIFDEAIYGAVRFHHRSMREYLTAKWLYRLLLQEKSRRTIESLFFANRYGREVVVPSMRSILAWLILWDDRIREKTAQISPEIFIQGGDPSALPTDIRQLMLKKFCEQYAGQKIIESSFDFSEIRRFAHPDLGKTISHLLTVYSNHKELQYFLFRIVWQGDMKDCSEQALDCALDEKIDVYTRIYGIRTIKAVGSLDQRKNLVDGVLNNPICNDERLIGEMISNFAPDMLEIQNILKLIQRVEKSGNLPNSWLKQSLQDLCSYKCPDQDIFELIRGLSLLLKQPPFIEHHLYKISQEYGWLLSYSAVAVERLIHMRDSNTLDQTILEIIALTQDPPSDIGYYSKEHELSDLIPKWAELNRKLFWCDINLVRQWIDLGKCGSLISWNQVAGFQHYWRFTQDDFEETLKDIATKTDDDRLVALSLAFQLYKESGRKRSYCLALKKAVSGVKELEETLNHFLKPPSMSLEEKRWRRLETERQRKYKQNEIKKAEHRQKWHAWLQANTNDLRDTSIAKKGSVWQATDYLIRKLRKNDYSRKLAVSNWQSLVSEFGVDVAEAYRDGCMGYWRNYRPEIRSESPESSNIIAGAVIVGLSGIAIEAQYIPDWPINLLAHEAELACRYAVREWNGFPDWLTKLHAVFPTIVEATFLREIEWEFAQYDRDDICHYILSGVAWHLDWFKSKITSQILDFLKIYEPKHDDTVQKALEIVLSSSSLDQNNFITIAKSKVSNTNTTESRLVIWLAAWMRLEAKSALEALSSILDEIGEGQQATDFSMRFIVELFGERHQPVQSEYKDYIQVEILLSLIKLMCTHIRSSEDIDHRYGGVYSPELRDDAQDARNKLSQLLRNIPGKATYLALMSLAQDHPDIQSREWYAIHAKERAEIDSEAEAWKPEDIANFAIQAEKTPQNHRELFDLTVSRLIDLKADLENGDSSNAKLLQLTDKETMHRIYIGNWLRDRSLGKYSVPQEEELADAKRPDIRIHGNGFDGPVPIELKIVDSWTGTQLLERLNNQLCNQYLRDSRSNCGIFLLVYLGKKSYWEHPKTRNHLSFSELLRLLEEEAKEIIEKTIKIESIRIIGFDLPRRNITQQST